MASVKLTLKDVKSHFEAVNTANIDELTDTIKTLLKGEKVGEMPSEWDSFTDSGAILLTFVDQQKEKFGKKVDLFKSGGQVLGVISDILEAVGKTHWAVAGLSVIGHLIRKAKRMSDNQDNCLQLLQYMADLAAQIKKLRSLATEEKERLKNALAVILKGAILCAKQIISGKIFRFVKSSLDSTNLSNIRSEIMALYPRIQLTVLTALLVGQPQRLPVRPPHYPAYAVGIKERVQHVKDLLQMGTDEPFRAVIIYGIGGIGKTTLADAVYSKLNLSGYKHSGLRMDPAKNNNKEMQQQILKDAFPTYMGGRGINLRDREGKEILKEAFEQTKEHVFLFIDNVMRVEDLKDFLPLGLERLRKNHIVVRLLITTRNLYQGDMFDRKLCHTYLVKQLPDSDVQTFLGNKTENLLRTKDVKKISKICGGVPLIIEIVCGHLKNIGYSAKKISQILDALQRGEPIEESELSKRMVDDVYDRLANFSREAFLDICCFFDSMRRTRVESIVGVMAFQELKDAALITITMDAQYSATMERNEERVVVHRVIKARGRKMAESTRIRNIQSYEAAIREERLQNIKGIKLYCDKHHSYKLKKEELDSMSKSLRVFVLGPNISVSSRTDVPFPELRYVELAYNIPYVPFHLEELKTLAMYFGPLLKQGDRTYKMPESLRHILTADNLEQPKPMPVAPHSSLQELRARSFSKKTLPKELQSFTALKTLTLHDSHEMGLPEVICGLPWLTTLRLVECRLKDLPRSFGHLTSLKHLALEDCERLETLPSSLVGLKALRYLNLKGCTSLEKLPSNFGKLRALRGLNMNNCAHLEDVPGFEQLKGLRYLNIQYCPKLSRDFRNIHKDLQIVG